MVRFYSTFSEIIVMSQSRFRRSKKGVLRTVSYSISDIGYVRISVLKYGVLKHD